MRLAGSWSVYLTQRSTKKQSEIRVARKTRTLDATNRETQEAVLNLDKVLHNLGISAVAICFKTVFHW
jgi:hypothetical protein